MKRRAFSLIAPQNLPRLLYGGYVRFENLYKEIRAREEAYFQAFRKHKPPRVSVGQKGQFKRNQYLQALRFQNFKQRKAGYRRRVLHGRLHNDFKQIKKFPTAV